MTRSIIPKKLMRKSKEIKQKWKGTKNFDIFLSIIFSCHNQSLISGRKTGHQALPPNKFETFVILPSLLRS